MKTISKTVTIQHPDGFDRIVTLSYVTDTMLPFSKIQVGTIGIAITFPSDDHSHSLGVKISKDRAIKYMENPFKYDKSNSQMYILSKEFANTMNFKNSKVPYPVMYSVIDCAVKALEHNPEKYIPATEINSYTVMSLTKEQLESHVD